MTFNPYVTKDSVLQEKEFVYPRKLLVVANTIDKNFLKVPLNRDMQTVANLKAFAIKHLGLENRPFLLHFGRKVLDENTDKDQLDKYLIHNKQWAIVAPKTKGLTRAINFTNMEKNKTIEFSQASDVPRWRYAAKGLCIEGPCMNPTCEAFYTKTNSLVIMPQGFGDFDMLYDSDKCKCTLCQNAVAPKTCAFNNCKWSFTGVRSGTSCTPVVGDWKEVGNQYLRFSDSESDQSSWGRLVLFTKTLEEPEDDAAICNLCLDDFSTGKKKKTKCGCAFHENCLSDWKASNDCCPVCRAKFNPAPVNTTGVTI
jgi:hypothetical protein